MHNAADSARYDEAGSVKPKNSRTGSGTGSVIDPRSKYPSTIEFASAATPEKVNSGAKSRRPGGSMRRGHPFGCSCGEHPCKCGTNEAKKHVIHPNLNE